MIPALAKLTRQTAVVPILAVVLLAAPPASGAVILDQQQPVFSTTDPHLQIGGPAEQKLAQTVTAGRSGRLVRIDLPVACEGSGDLLVSVTELTETGAPGGAVLGTTRVPAARLFETDPWTVREITLSAAITVATGDRFAMVLDVDGAICSTPPAPPAAAYRGGEAYYDARPEAPGWLALGRSVDDPDDLPFKTWVDVPSDSLPGFCTLATGPAHLGGPGPVRLPIAAFVPACRCFSDAGLRSQRCGLFLPDFFLFRELLRPPDPGGVAEIRWTLVPLVERPRVPMILETLSAGAEQATKRAIDFGRALEAFEPISRNSKISVGEPFDLDDWAVEYRWPEQPAAR